MTKKIEYFIKNCIKVPLFLIGIIPYISCFIAVYWLFNSDHKKSAEKFSPLLTKILYFSAFFSVVVILTIGIYGFFELIPSIGGEVIDDGEFSSSSWTVPVEVGLIASLFILFLFKKYDEKKKG